MLLNLSTFVFFFLNLYPSLVVFRCLMISPADFAWDHRTESALLYGIGNKTSMTTT